MRRQSFQSLFLSWFAAKAPLFRFAAKFCTAMVLFYIVSLAPLCQRILSAAAACNAGLSNTVLRGMGEGTHVTGGTIWSESYSMTVLPGCTGLEFSMFFCAVLIAFPSRLARKISGILIGVALLLALNLVRLVSLYYLGAHFARFFDTAHEELWGIPLIIASVALCAVWIAWVQKDARFENDAAA